MSQRALFQLTLVLTVVWTGLLSACKHDPEIIKGAGNPSQDTTSNTTLPSSQCSPDTVYFQQQVLPLLSSGCTMSGCHDAITHKEGVKLVTYTDIVATGGINIATPTSSRIYRAMVKNEERMPPSPAAAFTSDQLNIISKWIGQGARDNSCLESGCDTTNVAYSTHIKPLISNNCLGCHNGSNAGGGISLSLYSDVKAIADNGKFMGTISHLTGYSAMPKNGNKLTDCQINMVKIWINAGAPNN